MKYRAYFHWNSKNIADLLTNLKDRTRFHSLCWNFISGGIKLRLREGLPHDNTFYKFKWEKGLEGINAHEDLEMEELKNSASYNLTLKIAVGRKDYAPIDQTEFFQYMRLLEPLIGEKNNSQKKLPKVIELDTGMHTEVGQFMPIQPLLRRGYEINRFNIQGGFTCYSDWLRGSESLGYFSYDRLGNNLDPHILNDLQNARFLRISGELEKLLREKKIISIK